MAENQNTYVAEVYSDATLEPGKPEFQRRFLLSEGLLREGEAHTQQAAWRLIDPEGQVGMEVTIVSVGERLFQVPLTYRPEPLPADVPTLGEMAHSVLGTRYIYDARRDPAFRDALNAVVREGGTAASKRDLSTGEVQPPQVEFRVIPGEGAEVLVVLDDQRNDDAPGTLMGTWGEEPQRYRAVLASQAG
ncbi:maltokinase N-terminal cap-like domain-containing protein [Corynebacterium lowii]|uniref:Maltokinase N-terminal cap domain-containing protein n=1 Tax=Corynebacterium lowii TaxID=1544413 RepID=A0A0Q0ZAF8_9CORY|nr:hypothetical protein [Corynebacterium lowii]KQB86862.1 hypothetical protein Clow_01073 [Corynebacterium lowii]MDP9851550.1 hypothetical protein [Corynebacterium lowii]